MTVGFIPTPEKGNQMVILQHALSQQFRAAIFLLFLLTISAEALPAQSTNGAKKLEQMASRLQNLQKPIGPVRSGDWLESHKEPGQSFRKYIRSRPVRLSKKRNRLYVLPLGEFDETQSKIVDLSSEFLGIYFGCKVKQLATLSLDDAIPKSARRVHPSWGVRQIKSTFVLSDVLPPKLPDDAVALIALTTSDLYPDDDWNFVFGQASLKNRVGVWSLFRNGDPETEFIQCLRRTLHTATHETGHMFSIQHCTAYSCNMCGSNSQQESDRRPLHLCQECMPKIWWSTKVDPEKRFRELLEFCQQHKLEKETEYYQAALKAIRN